MGYVEFHSFCHAVVAAFFSPGFGGPYRKMSSANMSQGLSMAVYTFGPKFPLLRV